MLFNFEFLPRTLDNHECWDDSREKGRRKENFVDTQPNTTILWNSSTDGDNEINNGAFAPMSDQKEINGEEVTLFRSTDVKYVLIETFPWTTRSLVIANDWNGILDTSKDCVGEQQLEGWSAKALLNSSGISNCMRSSNQISVELVKSQWIIQIIIKVFNRLAERRDISCPHVQIVGYSDHKFETFTVNLGKTIRLGAGYWNRKASFPVQKDFKDRISRLLKQEFTGTTINNK